MCLSLPSSCVLRSAGELHQCLRSLSCRDFPAQGGEEGEADLTLRRDVRLPEAAETGLVSTGQPEDLACNTVLGTWGLGRKCLGRRGNNVEGTS